MNKTIKYKSDKQKSDVPRPDFINLGVNQAGLEIVPDPGPKNPILEWKSSSVWRPFDAANYLEQKNGDWLPMIHDLLHNLDDIALMLRYALLHTDWLNAFLLAAGMNQIIEDYLHPDPLFLGKAALYLGKIKGPAGAILGSSALTLRRGLIRFNEWTPQTHRIARIQRQTAKLVSELARLVISAENSSLVNNDQLIEDAAALIEQVLNLPAGLRSEVMRLPSCFQSFDQQPEDIRRIIEKFTLHWPDLDQPLYIIGIRTSGSYLAPLYAATLDSLGYRKVTLLTLRPGKPLHGYERKVINKIVELDGLALLCDDPPITGSTITKTARILEHAGVLTNKIILLLQLFGDSVFLPASLHKYPSVLMTWNHWSIHQKITLETVRAVLSDAAAPTYQISHLDRLPYSEGEDNRQHVCAVFRVKLLNPVTSKIFTRLVQVKGIGLGYFGEHVFAISQKLPGYSPEMIAVHAGLIYREILPDSRSLAIAKENKENKWIGFLVGYLLERNHQLPVHADTSLRLYGRNAAWEVASNILSQAFGKAWLVARLPLVDPFVKTILKTTQSSIIDGDMSPKNWYFRETIDFPLMKMNLAERDFSHMDLFSYDPVYDLAGLALEIEDNRLPSQVRCDYETISGEKISPERWVLYQLVHLWDMERQKISTHDSNLRRMAKVIQSYYEEIYFQSLKIIDQGPLCALDVDGVLETNQLVFPSLTSSSAISLRALTLHGYRVILATGRSVEELKDRCEAYHLAGGVAEYGAVLYDHTSGLIQSLLKEDEIGTLSRLRTRLANAKGIYIDPAYHYSVRAFQLDRNGHRRGLSKDVLNDLLSEPGASDKVYAINGLAQTDFMVSGINKGVGIKEWLAQYDHGTKFTITNPCEATSITLAMGDGWADLPMLALARQAFVPSHARQHFRIGGIQVTSHPYQRGFEQAVAALLGHEPGRCPTCHVGTLAAETQYMLDLLSIQENGTANMISGSLRLYWRKARKYHVNPQ